MPMNSWSAMEGSGANRRHLPREIVPGVLVCDDAHEVARAAARLFVDWAWQAIARDGHFNVALSGGSTPREMYRVLATTEYRAQVDWPRVHLFWGDERTVPPDNPDSNYGMARRELLLRVPIPPANVHRMEAEEPVIGRAAHAYETLLRRFLPLDDRGFPVFDLVLLGLGPEGHTASLFPGSRLLRETSRWVSTPMVAKLKTRRMSLTMPVLEAARRLLFLVTGPEKAAILHEVLYVRRPHPLPAQMAVPRKGDRTFLVDEAAAALLKPDVAGSSSPPAESAKPGSAGPARPEGKP
jgi:6-phosphogluconolactonase